jgi:putative DNA methylase
VDAARVTAAEFVAALRGELPDAIRLLQTQSIAPVDMAQSAIGPGMGVFSRYAEVVEADGAPMSVRRALILINEVLQEVLSEEETEFDGDTRWALTWYEQNGLNPGGFGDADTLSKAKNTSVRGVVGSGIAVQREGKVRLKDRDELVAGWDPSEDPRPTVWEGTQHLIAALGESESDAADLLRRLGSAPAERARQLSYLLYQVADRKGWVEEAVAYNGLVQAWPEISRLAGQSELPVQQSLGE